METLKQGRFYKVEATAFENAARTTGRKLTVRSIRKHFAKVDKKRIQRLKMMELSNGNQNVRNNRIGQGLQRKRAQAWAANANKAFSPCRQAGFMSDDGRW